MVTAARTASTGVPVKGPLGRTSPEAAVRGGDLSGLRPALLLSASFLKSVEARTVFRWGSANTEPLGASRAVPDASGVSRAMQRWTFPTIARLAPHRSHLSISMRLILILFETVVNETDTIIFQIIFGGREE